MTTVDEARELARSLLAEAMPRRWTHVQGVADEADSVSASLSLPDVLVSAAWLHDIGYEPKIAATGFHPLDGARYLRRVGVDERIVRLVAYHSCALLEATVRGLDSDLLAEFTSGEPVLADALCFCDMTTSPDGEPVAPPARLAEIQARYG